MQTMQNPCSLCRPRKTCVHYTGQMSRNRSVLGKTIIWSSSVFCLSLPVFLPVTEVPNILDFQGSHRVPTQPVLLTVLWILCQSFSSETVTWPAAPRSLHSFTLGAVWKPQLRDGKWVPGAYRLSWLQLLC